MATPAAKNVAPARRRESHLATIASNPRCGLWSAGSAARQISRLVLGTAHRQAVAFPATFAPTWHSPSNSAKQVAEEAKNAAACTMPAAFLDYWRERGSGAAAGTWGCQAGAARQSNCDSEQRCSHSVIKLPSGLDDLPWLGGADAERILSHRQPSQMKPFTPLRSWTFGILPVRMFMAARKGSHLISQSACCPARR